MSEVAGNVALFVSGENDPLVKGAIDEVCTQAGGRTEAASRALLALFKRIAGSWDSLRILATTPEDLDRRANDCAAILRCMYDAYLQAAYIASDPKVLGKLYVDFAPVERRKAEKAVVNQDNKMAHKIATSQKRVDGERRGQEEFDRVRPNYKRVKGRGLRIHWYVPEHARDLAELIGKDAEYVWFFARYNSAIHSGPWATLDQSSSKLPMVIKEIATLIVFRTAKLVIDNDRLQTSKETNELVQAYDVDFLNM